jgi:phospholipase C
LKAPPDAYTSQFAFNRYGVRVPAVLISPFIPKGTIDHRVFDHASIPATLKQLFGLPSFLTHRDATAQTFLDVASLEAPRTDAPASLGVAMPAAQVPPGEVRSLADLVSQRAAEPVSTAPLSDLQRALVDLAHTLDLQESPELRALRQSRRIDNESEAALYVREVAERYAEISRKGGWQ